MRITVKVKPKSKRNSVEKIDETHYQVRVMAPPLEGKANEAVIRILAKNFNVPKSSIQLIMGARSKQKVFEIKG